MTKVLTLLFFGLIVWYWSFTQKAKQLAVIAGKRRCREAGVQFLDHTVVQSQLRLKRDASKRWRFLREYQFEFTSTGEQRYVGRVVLQGYHVVVTELEAFTLN